MQLIIAEKPVLGQAIADAIPGSHTYHKNEQYIEVGDYTIIWAFGHILTLKDPEDYDPALKNWSLDTLPIFYPDWGQKPKPASEEDIQKKRMTPEDRLNQIGEFLKKADSVIHAGDIDDEGQLLIDEILRWHHYTGKVYRLDTNDMAPAALAKALKNMGDNKDRENDGWAAFARSVADMTIGYNCSRYFTLKNPGTLLTVGRVQTAALGLVVARDAKIEGHVKSNYYEITVDLEMEEPDYPIPCKYKPAKTDPHLEDGKILDKSYMEEKVRWLETAKVPVANITKKQISEFPPLPFNQTKLTSYCSSKFGYTPSQVLDITQRLREQYKCITYNRSDCRYLSEEQYAQAPGILDQVFQNIAFRPKRLDKTIKSSCFDSSKISAHTAIIPTEQAVDLSKMSADEKNVYLAICKYYIVQFMPPAVKIQSRLEAPLSDGGMLTSTSTDLVDPGYLSIFKGDQIVEDKKENDDEEHSELSDLEAGEWPDNWVSKAELQEKETKPPARYTQASLAEDMTRIAKYVDDPKIKKLLLEKDKDKEGENGSIGTGATRPSIITKLLERQFLVPDGNKKMHIKSSPLGRELYRILPDELKKPDMTAYWWAVQKEIMAGNEPWTTLANDVYETAKRIVHTEYPSVDMAKIPEKMRRKNSRVPVGICPRCGGTVVEGKRGFGCLGYKDGCKFTIWKESKLSLLSQQPITAKIAKALLEGGWEDEMAEDGSGPTGRKISVNTVVLDQLYSTKKERTFTGAVRLVDDLSSEYGPDFKLVPYERPSLGKCPRCGGEIKEFAGGFSCSNRESGCQFVIWKTAKGGMMKNTTISAKDVEALLKGKSIKKTKLVKNDGTFFSAELVLKDDPKSPYGAGFAFAPKTGTKRKK